LSEADARIVLIGGRGEKQFTRPIALATNEQVTDLSERTTLGQLAAILQKADLFIGNDSGPMHLAAACGTKVIGLFGPTSPQRFGPYGSGCVALRMEDNCPPCMKEECRRPGYRCIDSISVDDVMKTVKELLSQDNNVDSPTTA
jgi:ADP-heptose:LPS heptosyltransferase